MNTWTICPEGCLVRSRLRRGPTPVFNLARLCCLERWHIERFEGRARGRGSGQRCREGWRRRARRQCIRERGRGALVRTLPASHFGSSFHPRHLVDLHSLSMQQAASTITASPPTLQRPRTRCADALNAAGRHPIHHLNPMARWVKRVTRPVAILETRGHHSLCRYMVQSMPFSPNII